MKRKTVTVLIVCTFFVFASALLHIIRVNTKDFNDRLKSYDTEVFVPEGRADRYKELAVALFQDWEIYEYRLESEEIAEIEKELNNGFWVKIDVEDKEYFLRDYFYGPFTEGRIWQKDFNLSDEVYVSSYAGYQRPFSYSETASFDNGAVFVYDKGNSVYYGFNTYLGR